MTLVGGRPRGRPPTRGRILLSTLIALLAFVGIGLGAGVPAPSRGPIPGRSATSSSREIAGSRRPAILNRVPDEDRRPAGARRAPRRRPLHLRARVLRRRAGAHRGVRGRGARHLRGRRAAAPPRGELRGELGDQDRGPSREGRHPGRRPLQPGRGPEGRGGHPPEVRGRGVLRRPDHAAHRAHAGGRPPGGVPDRGGAEAPHRQDHHRGEQGAHRGPDQGRDVRRRSACTGSSRSRRCSGRSSTTMSTASSSSTRDHGFIQARVESTEIVPDLARKKVTLHVRVVEGPQFRTGTITITGNELLSTEEIRKLVNPPGGRDLQPGGAAQLDAGDHRSLLRAGPGAGRRRPPDDERPGRT